jgi:hypothetical protein
MSETLNLFPAQRHDPGGAVRLTLPSGGSAILGGGRDAYRYRLSRTGSEGPRVLFVMMNRSTADPMADDPPVAKLRPPLGLRRAGRRQHFRLPGHRLATPQGRRRSGRAGE